MDTFTYIAVLCGTLVLNVLAAPQPSVESMIYEIEVGDKLEDFYLQATAYFSQEHRAYRFDFDGGMNIAFFYPEAGQFYYYYPGSDFRVEEFNVTRCWSALTYKVPSLFSPPPSLEYFTDLGPDNVYDVPAEKYVNYQQGETTEIWVVENDATTGIHQRPIQKVIKKWIENKNGIRDYFTKQEVTGFYAFSAGEQHPSLWERPLVTCQPADHDITGIFSSLLSDIGVPEELIEFLPSPDAALSSSVKQRKYMTGRSFIANDQNHPSGLLLTFPYTQEQIISISKQLPESYDWRDFGAVTPVKNQRSCGSCWAFGTVGSLEGAYFLKHNESVTMSEQALIDCAGSMSTNGCYGGWDLSGFAWVKQAGGIPPTEEYSPYQEINGYCRVNDRTKSVADLKGYYHVPTNTDALKVALVMLGPIVVSIDAHPLQRYKDGVVIEGCDHHRHDHSVLLVGYGESDEYVPYWIIKNSWGTDWGHEGYTFISAKGNCLGILDHAFFPVLK